MEKDAAEAAKRQMKKRLRKQKKRLARRAKGKTRQTETESQQEQIRHLRNVNGLSVYGETIPNPTATFTELGTLYGVEERILENIKSVGFSEPTPIQMQALPIMLEGRNILACAPTGSGKTAAFAVPLIQSLKKPDDDGLRALILSPTRELAQQTQAVFNQLSSGMGLRIHYIDTHDKYSKHASCDILITTPNRLVYLLKTTPPAVDLTRVEWFIVDESDKMFEDGKAGFREQLAVIFRACNNTLVKRGFFSATFTGDVEEWCRLHLANLAQVYVGARNSSLKTIEQKLQFVGCEFGKTLAIRRLVLEGLPTPALIFVQSKQRAQELYKNLQYEHKLPVGVIHSDLSQEQREKAIERFRTNDVWILICTDLLGRGLDFKDVNFVINYDFPNSAISYIHRVGRTGRAGRPGKALTFFTEDDAVNLRSIGNVIKQAGCPVPDYILELKRPNRKERKQLARKAPFRPRVGSQYWEDSKKRQKDQKMRKDKAKRQKTDGDDVTTTKS